MLKQVDQVHTYHIRLCDICEEHAHGTCNFCGRDFCKKHDNLVYLDDVYASVCEVCQEIVEHQFQEYKEIQAKLITLKHAKQQVAKDIYKKLKGA